MYISGIWFPGNNKTHANNYKEIIRAWLFKYILEVVQYDVYLQVSYVEYTFSSVLDVTMWFFFTKIGKLLSISISLFWQKPG